jgi:preprotein translocase subunit SecA
LLEYDDVMNQQRQVVYDIRKQALNDEDISDAVLDMVEEYVDDEINRMEDTSPQNWDWEHLRQNLSSHLLVDVDYTSVKESAESDEVSIEDARNFILGQAKEVYQTRKSLLPDDVMRGFEKFVMLRTIDEKWKDHLYAMDQIREGINLRAYGQKNPLLEYKSEGFQMFQQMMVDTTEETVQRLYRTQIRGMEAAPEMPVSRARNVQTQHDETTGMGFSGPSMQEQAAASSGVPKQPVHADEKIGRNEKVRMVSPSGKEVEVKYKKLQQYLNQGYTQV